MSVRETSLWTMRSAPLRASFGRDRDAHAPRRAVAEKADGIERLARAAGRHEEPLPAQHAAAMKELQRSAEDLLRFSHPSHAKLTFCCFPFVGPHEPDAPLP